MNFTSQDIVLIDKALHSAIQNETNEYSKRELREVLLKLQTSSHEALKAVSAASALPIDGFRYDYDDAVEFS